MGCTFVSVGAPSAVQAVGPSSLTPGLPAGWLPDDILVAQVGCLGNTAFFGDDSLDTVTTPAGWTLLVGPVVNTNPSFELITRVYWRRAVAGDAAPSFVYTSTNAFAVAMIAAYRGAVTKDSPWAVVGAPATNASSGTATSPAITTIKANQTVLELLTLGQGSGATPGATAFGGSPTPTWRAWAQCNGTDGSIVFADFTQPAAGSTGSRTATLNASTESNGVLLALIDAPTPADLLTDAYRRQLIALLPPGVALDIEPDSVISDTLAALAQELQRVDGRGDDLIDEADPRTAVETLSDWERALSLPDLLVTEIPGTTAGRQQAITQKFVSRGGQNYNFFAGLVQACGYTLASITLYADSVLKVGFRAGARCYGPAWAYSMQLNINAPGGSTYLDHATVERVIQSNTHSHILAICNFL